MTIYLVRHGDPDYKNDTITQKGHMEAGAVSKRLAAIGIDKIYTSPMGRARATMQYTADLLNMQHGVEEWAQEISNFGIEYEKWGYLAAWNTPGEVIFSHKPFPTVDNWFNAPYLDKLPARDTYEYIVKGSDEFFARHGYSREGGLYRIVKPNKDKIVLFAHGGFGLTWLAHLLNIPVPVMWCGFNLPTTSVTTIVFEEHSDEWASPRCLGIGDISHLQ